MSTRDDHHVEVLSRWRGNRITIVAISIPITTICIIGGVAIWPFLSLIGEGLVTLFIVLLLLTLAVSISQALKMIVGHYYDMQRSRFEAPIIQRGDVVVFVKTNGEYTHLSAEHEQGKLPPPATITVSEEVPEPTLNLVQQSADVIDLHNQGQGYESIAKLYKGVGIEYWSEWRVRKLCEEYENKREVGTKKREKSTKNREV